MIRVGRLSEEKELKYSRTIDDVTSMYTALSKLVERTSSQETVMADCLEHAQLFVDSDISVARLTAEKRDAIRAIWAEADPDRR
jgi:hypothetical protein